MHAAILNERTAKLIKKIEILNFLS